MRPWGRPGGCPLLAWMGGQLCLVLVGHGYVCPLELVCKVRGERWGTS